MASGASVSIGVDVTQFKQGMQQAQQSAKSLSAQLKANEAQFRATGDKEQYLADKAKLLKAQLDAQKTAAANAQKALEAMRDSGIAETSSEYQKLQTQLANATAAMYDTETALNELTGSEQQAAGCAAELTSSLDSINKKVSLDSVINGIDKITGGLESAAKKAIEVGEHIWDNIVNSAKHADDVATLAQVYEVPLTKYLQMEALVSHGLDTSVDSMLTSMNKMKRGVGNGTKATMDALKELGLVVTEYGGKTKQGFDRLVTQDQEELFWRAGQALMEMSDAFDKEASAQAIFGRSWRELIPLFTEYHSKDEFNEALESMNVNTEDEIEKLAELSNELGGLQADFQVLQDKVLAGLAPALTTAADALSGVLQNVIEYLEKPDGQKALKDMEEAVSGLFSDLSKIDPEQVVEGFSSVFNSIVGGFQWMVENKETLKGILGAIVTVWGTAELVNGALDVLQLIQGIQGLTGAGAAAAAGQAGATAGAAWGAGFAKAVIAAAPWLVGVYTLLNPADTGDDGYAPNVDAAGMATTKGMEWLKTVYKNPGLTDTQKGMTVNDPAWEMVPFVADVFGQMSDILNDPMAAGAILQFGDDITGLVAALEGLGYEKNMTEGQYSEYLRKRREESNAAEEDLNDFGESAESASEIVAGLSEGMLSLGEESGATSGDLGGLGESAEEAAAALEQAAAAAQSFNPYAFWIGGSHANGLFSVPWDGYPALLHKGERVLTAGEAKTYNANSHLYVDRMYMNNDMDAERLADILANRNRRVMKGYGT